MEEKQCAHRKINRDRHRDRQTEIQWKKSRKIGMCTHLDAE